MQVLTNKRKEELALKRERAQKQGDRNKTVLSLYKDAPTEEITLSEFETMAVCRLEVLKKIETYRANGLKLHEVGGNGRKTFADTLALYQLKNRRVDHLSHFVLRLAYCRSESLRRWFLTQECLLFKYRFDMETDPKKIQEFFETSGLTFIPIAQEDMLRLQEQLKASDFKGELDTEYFKVPFEEALELVGRRMCFLMSGFAYVPRKDLVSIVVSKFRAHISRELAACFKASQNVKADRRLRPIINGLQKQYISTSYVPAVAGGVTKEQLPALAARSFPLCMDHSYSHLRDDHHLKHGARMQLGLFLKGIGLELKDALLVWKQMMAKKTPAEEFEKKYAYNIRHNYGKEGKRQQYTPYGCRKIIMALPGHQDYHGCPFKNFDETSLRAKLVQKRVTKMDTDDIIEKVKGHHYQVACMKYFAATHNGKFPEDSINHPNSYFDESVKYWNAKEGVTTSAPKSVTNADTGSRTTASFEGEPLATPVKSPSQEEGSNSATPSPNAPAVAVPAT